MSRLRSPTWRLAMRCPGLPAPRCAARAWLPMTQTFCRQRSVPTPADRARLSWRSPARTRAPRSRGGATWTAPASFSIRRSPFTSVSTPRVTSPGPRPRYGRWVSAAAAGSLTAAPKAAGRASPQASGPWWTWSPRDCPTPKSASGCTFHAGRCKRISRTCSPSFTSPPAPSLPPRRRGTRVTSRATETAQPAPEPGDGADRRRTTRFAPRPLQQDRACPGRLVRLSRGLSEAAAISAPLTGRDISQLADASQAVPPHAGVAASAAVRPRRAMPKRGHAVASARIDPIPASRPELAGAGPAAGGPAVPARWTLLAAMAGFGGAVALGASFGLLPHPPPPTATVAELTRHVALAAAWLEVTGTLLQGTFALALAHLAGARTGLAGKITIVACATVLGVSLVYDVMLIAIAQSATLAGPHAITAVVAYGLFAAVEHVFLIIPPLLLPLGLILLRAPLLPRAFARLAVIL